MVNEMAADAARVLTLKNFSAGAFELIGAVSLQSARGKFICRCGKMGCVCARLRRFCHDAAPVNVNDPVQRQVQLTSECAVYGAMQRVAAPDAGCVGSGHADSVARCVANVPDEG